MGRLPGHPLSEGISCDEAFQQLISGKLAPLEGNFRLNRVVLTAEMQESSTYRIRTKYTRSIHHAVLETRFQDIHGFIKVHDPGQFEEIAAQRVYAFNYNGVWYLYAWLTDDDF